MLNKQDSLYSSGESYLLVNQLALLWLFNERNTVRFSNSGLDARAFFSELLINFYFLNTQQAGS